MNPYQLSFLFFGICTFFIAILIWLKRGDHFGRVYFFFSSVTAVWSVGFSLMVNNYASYESALFATRIAEMGAPFISAAWVHVTSILVKQESKNRKLICFGYLAAIIFGLCGFSEHYVSHVAPMMQFKHYARPGLIFHFYLLFFLIYAPLGMFILIKNIEQFKGEEKKRMQGFAFATGTGFLGGFFTFLPIYGISFPQYTVLLLPIYPFAMAYFMIKKNLFSEEDFVMAAHRDKLAFMGTLSSSINHEIRNPLYIAQGSSESFLQSLDENLISKNDAGEKAIQILRESKKQISRALDIVASFSNFTKIDANEDQKTKVDVSHVIHNVLTFVGHEATKKKIKITKGIGDESVQILVNERQLEQILLNLILNAIQAFKKTEGLIELNIKRSESQIEIKIEDNGPGMAKKQLDQIFEPFYTTKEEGTGLGLYITKQLVERNGGTIKVESKEGSGTTFILEFKRL